MPAAIPVARKPAGRGDALGAQQPACASACLGHGATPTIESPSVSGQPSARFIDCTAAPPVPLTRLSIAAIATNVAASSSTATASCAALLPITAPVVGSCPSGSRWTNGSPP